MEEQQEDRQQRLQQEQTRRFDQALARLRTEKLESFSFWEAGLGAHGSQQQGRWTIEQALNMSKALDASTGISNLSMELGFCRPEAVGVFVTYIGSSQSLNSLLISYKRNFTAEGNDSLDLNECYKVQGDLLFRAVLQNPSIEKLEARWLASPTSTFELLSQTMSLKTFDLSTGIFPEADDPDYEMAFHVSAGFRQNSSLEIVEIHVSNSRGNLGRLISGLERHVSVRDVTIHFKRPDSYVYESMSNMIHFTPSLKKLTVEEGISYESCFSPEVNFDKVLLGLFQPNLCQPVGVGLKILKLVNVRIGAGWENIQESVPVARDKVNTVLEHLTLDSVKFLGRNAPHLLLHFAGLRTLAIEDVVYRDSLDDDRNNAGIAEQNSSVWRKLMECNPKLEKVSTLEVNVACLNGILQGACDLLALDSLEHRFGPNIDESTGALLRRLLEKTKSLKKLVLEYLFVTRGGADQLASGISSNATLDYLSLNESDMAGTTCSAVIGSLIVNKKLEYLCFGDPWDESTPQVQAEFRNTLVSMVQANSTLLHFQFPPMVLSPTMIDDFFAGLANRKCPFKTLNFSKCDVGQDGLAALGSCLMSENSNVFEVELPHISGESEEAFKTFIDCLKHVPRRFNVKFHGDNVFDRELLDLLLQAAKENSKLIDVDCTVEETDVDISHKIDYYLKLNRFGRSLFGCSSKPNSLWPLIFEPMASSPKDSDALFYFLREYFTSSKTGQASLESMKPSSSSSPSPSSPPSRPSKRART